jgi:hypothetical protein
VENHQGNTFSQHHTALNPHALPVLFCYVADRDVHQGLSIWTIEVGRKREHSSTIGRKKWPAYRHLHKICCLIAWRLTTPLRPDHGSPNPTNPTWPAWKKIDLARTNPMIPRVGCRPILNSKPKKPTQPENYTRKTWTRPNLTILWVGHGPRIPTRQADMTQPELNPWSGITLLYLTFYLSLPLIKVQH